MHIKNQITEYYRINGGYGYGDNKHLQQQSSIINNSQLKLSWINLSIVFVVCWLVNYWIFTSKMNWIGRLIDWLIDVLNKTKQVPIFYFFSIKEKKNKMCDEQQSKKTIHSIHINQSTNWLDWLNVAYWIEKRIFIVSMKLCISYNCDIYFLFVCLQVLFSLCVCLFSVFFF